MMPNSYLMTKKPNYKVIWMKFPDLKQFYHGKETIRVMIKLARLNVMVCCWMLRGAEGAGWYAAAMCQVRTGTII